MVILGTTHRYIDCTFKATASLVVSTKEFNVRLPPRLLDHTIKLAAVCGSIFASPNPAQVRRGIDLVENDKG